MAKPSADIQERAQTEARKIARVSEYGLGNRTAFLRGISRKVEFVILKNTQTAEMCFHAYSDERDKMQREKRAFRALERAYENA